MKILAMMVLGISLLFGAVDINTANKGQLMSLKGVGDKKADAILQYRKDHCFKKIDDMVFVKGIGKKFIEKNRKDLTASKCKI